MPDTDNDKRSSVADDIAKSAAESTLALNPLVGVATNDILKASASVMRAMATQPNKLARQWLDLASEFTNIISNA